MDSLPVTNRNDNEKSSDAYRDRNDSRKRVSLVDRRDVGRGKNEEDFLGSVCG